MEVVGTLWCPYVGLAITNLRPLYDWFLSVLSRRLLIVDVGECSKFLSILIIRDHLHCRLWPSSHVYVSELLDDWNLSACKPASTPFPSNLSDLPVAPPNSLPDLADADLLPKYQHTVGCLLYLALLLGPISPIMRCGLASSTPTLLVVIFWPLNMFFAIFLAPAI